MAHVDWLSDAGAVRHIVAATQEKGKGGVSLSLCPGKVFIAWDFKGGCFQKADALYRHFVVGYLLKSLSQVEPCFQPVDRWAALQEAVAKFKSHMLCQAGRDMWRGIQDTCGDRVGDRANEDPEQPAV